MRNSSLLDSNCSRLVLTDSNSFNTFRLHRKSSVYEPWAQVKVNVMIQYPERMLHLAIVLKLMLTNYVALTSSLISGVSAICRVADYCYNEYMVRSSFLSVRERCCDRLCKSRFARKASSYLDSIGYIATWAVYQNTPSRCQQIWIFCFQTRYSFANMQAQFFWLKW